MDSNQSPLATRTHSDDAPSCDTNHQHEMHHLTMETRTSMLHKNDMNGTIASPRPGDILLGRGKPFQSHPGNEMMRRLADEYKDRYNSLPREKRGIVANELLDKILSSGTRFLKLCTVKGMTPAKGSAKVLSTSRCWEKATKAEAYEKLCHALRSKGKRRGDSSSVAVPCSLLPVLSGLSDNGEEDPRTDTTQEKEKATNSTNELGQNNAEDQHKSESSPIHHDTTNIAVMMALETYLGRKK